MHDLVHPRRGILRRRVPAVTALAVLFGCAEMVTQISESDVVELLLSADSARLAIGRTLQLEALPLDETGAFLAGQEVAWLSSNSAVATVDETGLVTGVTSGTAIIVASLAGAQDSATVSVSPLAALVLSSDSVHFSTTAGGASPARDSVEITNGGGFDLTGLAVDSVRYGAGASDWLTAQLDGSQAPATLTLEAQTTGTTASGIYLARVWLSGFDADNSPTSVAVTLAITAGLPAEVAANVGNGQSAAAGTSVAIPPGVRVTDAVGNGVSGIAVTFAVTSGGGSITGGSATTDATGVARVGSWTLGTLAGTGNNTLTATATGAGINGNPVTFAASATAAAAASITLVAGDGQSANANSAVSVAPRVLVRDAFGNAVPNHPVTFQVTGGGGTVLPATAIQTGLDGTASVTSWTLGTAAGANNNTLSATATGVASPVVFTASANAGTAASIVVSLGDNQSATVNTVVSVAPRVLVRDQFANPVADVPVTFQVTSGGGTVSPATAILTASDGTATATSWTLGTVAGANNNTLSAGAAGVASPAVFSASATAGAPTSIAIVSGNGQSASAGANVAIAPSVVVRDQFTNPVPSHAIAFQVTGGGGIVSPATAILTGPLGTASVTSWTLGAVAGAANNTMSATAAGSGVGGNPVVFTASATPGAAASVTIVAGNSQGATVGAAVAVQPQVLVADGFGNPIEGHPVTFQVTAGGGVVSPTTAVLTAPNGIATATLWTLGTIAGTNNNTLSATASGLASPAVFTATATASSAASIVVQAGNNQSATVNSAVAIDPQVLVRDQFDNPVANVAVTFQVTGGGGVIVPVTPIQTGSDGTATVTSWSLGTGSGINNNTLSATAAGVAAPATFTASATAGTPATIVVDAGNNQSAAVGSAVAIAPRVIVRDQFTNPIEGALVTFAVTGGGGSVVPITAVSTLPNGTATVTSWTLGASAGTNNNTLSATVSGVATPATFTASATAGGAASIVVDAGNSQTATVGVAVAIAPRVLVRDGSNNPVAGVPVTFQVTGGGGAVLPATTVPTLADGTATVTSWTLGTGAGTSNNTLSATVGGVGTPATFTASATAGAPFSVIVNAGNNQSVTVNTAVPVNPQVLVRDEFTNPVTSASVTFQVTNGGGAVVPLTAILTGPDGTATATSWTLGTGAGAGSNTLSAAAAGVASPAVFTATGLPDSAVDLIIAGGDNQAALAGFAVGVAPSVAALDQFGNGVPGETVLFTAISGGGSVGGANQVTGSTGVAAAGSWTLGGTPGVNTLRATAADIPDSVTFSATGITGQAESMQLEAGNAQSDTVGATLPVPYAVRVLDTNGIGVPGVPVTWTVTGGGGSIGASSTTNGVGVATSMRVLGTTAGSQTATASVGGLVGSPVVFSATGTAGAPTSVAVDIGNAQSDTVFTTVPIAPRVIVRDQFSNPVLGASVTFVASGGGVGALATPATPLLTLANGTATLTSWRLGQAAGTSNNTLTATAAGVGTPATFTASALAGPPTSVAVDIGNAQTDTVFTTVPIAPRVIVRDQFTNPVLGASVTFAASGGGIGALATPATPILTLANGTATLTSWRLGQTPGTNNNTLSATVPGVGTPATFTASAVAGSPASVAVDLGNAQTDTVFTNVPIAPRVMVRDQFSNPVPGASVTFAASGGGVGALATPATPILTLADGTATLTSWRLGQTAGTSNNTLTATVPGVVTPATFTASGLAGPATSVAVDVGNAQSDTVFTTVPIAPRVIVRDQFSNPVLGASVTFVASGGGVGALATPATPLLTLANGTATLTSWRLGQTAGSSNNTLTATAAGVGTPATFTATGLAGPPTSVVVDVGNAQSDTVFTTVPVAPRVIVRDQFTNPVLGASVTFAASGGGVGALATPATPILTLANGTATLTSWRLGQTPGTNNNTLSATVPGVGTPATFTASAVAGSPASVAVDLGNAQTDTVFTNVPIAPRVMVRDQFSNPVPGASVTFAASGGGVGALATPATPILTLADGTATLTSWRLGQTAGTSNNTLTATVPGVVTPATFTASGLAGPATSVAVDVGNAQSDTVFTTVPIAPRVIVRDQFSNPVLGASVTFVASGGGVGALATPATPLLTLANGTATLTSWRLGQTAGSSNNTLTATAAGVGTPATFTATGLAGPPTSVVVDVGNAQSDTVFTTVPVAPRVIVRDQFTNPVLGASVTFAASGGGVGALATPATPILTLANGTATLTSWRLGQTAGSSNNTLTATAVGVATPATFTATGLAGPPTSVAVDVGNAQSDTVFTTVPVAPRVIVRDQFTNPILGASVTFVASGGGVGALATPGTPIATIANGTATLTSWRLGQTAGSSNNTLTATAVGVATPATFTASGLAGSPASVAVVQGSGQTATTGANVSITPTVVVRDAFSNAVSGRTVNFSPSGSGSVGSPSPATNASGQAATTWAVNVGGHSMATNGTFQNTLTATVSGTAISTSLTGFARYSWATHVNPIWAASPSCTGCHGGSSGLTLTGTAAVNYDALFNINPTCDGGLVAAGWRRVNTSGGDNGYNLSVLRVLMLASGDVVGGCGPHATKMSAANLAILQAWIRTGAPEN